MIKIGIILKWIEINLDRYIYLVPYLIVTVSCVYTLVPKFFNIEFDYVNWGNGGGFSILASIVFINTYCFKKKRFCKLTRRIALSFIFISTANLISNKFFPQFYDLYGFLYEVLVYSTIFIISIITWLKFLVKSIYGNYITH